MSEPKARDIALATIAKAWGVNPDNDVAGFYPWSGRSRTVRGVEISNRMAARYRDEHFGDVLPELTALAIVLPKAMRDRISHICWDNKECGGTMVSLRDPADYDRPEITEPIAEYLLAWLVLLNASWNGVNVGPTFLYDYAEDDLPPPSDAAVPDGEVWP